MDSGEGSVEDYRYKGTFLHFHVDVLETVSTTSLGVQQGTSLHRSTEIWKKCLVMINHHFSELKYNLFGIRFDGSL